MADVKISALPTSTTPLAGTEVVPLVQSSTTKKVAVSDLTAGRDTSFKTGTATPRNGAVPTAGSVLTGLTIFNDQDAATGDGVSLFLDHSYRTPNTQTRGVKLNSYSTTAFAGYIGAKLQVTAAGAFLESVDFKDSGDVQLSAGNLVVATANKGIVFSGNSNILWRCGTGTPEGNVTAPVGSLFTRTDGGANTTLYVKESGTGNTGWVAK